MVIYGTALLALCHLAGIVAGDLLGRALGIPANVGGVGIAMLLLILSRLALRRMGWLSTASESGVHYWGALYIPVVVAMAMQQNVVAALRGGPLALAAATGSVLVCGLCVAAINRAEPPPHDPSDPSTPQPEPAHHVGNP
jgi:malonate transporter MadL subunit